MLAFLDSLCTALLARDASAICGLLQHPLARALPRNAREEALAIARAGSTSLRAPVHTLHFYHQTVHLLGAQAKGEPAVPPPGDAERASQMELPLRARAGTSSGATELRRAAGGRKS